MAQSGGGSQRGDLRFNAVLEDNVSPQVDKIARKMQQLGASKHEIKLMLRAHDEVTAKAQQIKQTLNNLPKDTKLNLSVMHQKAVEDIHKVHEKLQKVASSKPVEISMKVKSNVDEEIARIESHVTNARYRLQANVASLANAPVVGDIKRTAGFAMQNAGAAIGVPLAAGAAGAVLGAGAKSFQLQSQYEQDMVALRTSMKSATAAVAEMADVTKFARTTPFNQPDVLQTDITLRNYGIRPKGPIGTRTMGDIAAGTGQGLERSTDAVLAAVTRGDYRSLRGMGINLDQQDFAPGGRFQGKSQQEAIKQLSQMQFGGATGLYAKTSEGLRSNVQDIANLQVMRPIGQVPFQQGKQLLQTANERLTGDSPEAIRTQAKLGEAVDKVVLATSKLASNLKTVKQNFDTYFKQPLTEIITSLGRVAEIFGKAFGGTVVFSIQIVADALVAILKPLSALAEKFPILIQGFAAMKALKFVGGPDAAAGPERAMSGLNPLGQNFGPKNFFGGLKDTVKEVPALIVGGIVLSLLNAHKASVALKDSFNQYGAAGSTAAEQLSNSFDSFGMGLDRSVVKLKNMAAEINNLLGTGTATAEQRQKFLKDITPAALNAEDKGGLSKAYLEQIVLPQYKGGTGENGAADSKEMQDFLDSKQAELKKLFPNMTRDETTKKSDLVAKNYAAAEASLRARTARGSAGTSGLGGAPYAEQLLETLPQFKNMPKDVVTGKSILGDVHSQVEVRNKLMEAAVNLTPDAIKKGAEYEKAQAAALAPPGRPGPGLTTAEATARFMKNMSATAKPEQYLNTKFEDTPDALGRGSVLKAIKENEKTEEGRKKNIAEQNRFVAGLLSGLGKYGEERLPQVENQYFRDFGKNGSVQINQQALQTPGGVASEFQRMTQLAQVDIPKAMETLQSKMGTTDLRMKQLTMSQGILDNAQQKYTYDTVVPAQRALEDFSRVMMQTSRAMEDSSYRSGKAQFSMSQYTDGLLKGTNALNDQVHGLDMYQKQLQYLQLQQRGMMQDLSTTTVTRGYSSVIKPIMGFGLENAIEQAGRRKQMLELEKDLRITDNGQRAGDVTYQIQKNMRTGFAGTEYGAKRALEATKTLSGVMTEEIFKQRDLQDTQHEQVKTMRSLDDAAFAAQRGLRAFQDRQEAMRRKVHETNVEMQRQEIQLGQLDLLQKTALQQANGLGLMANAAIKNQGANSVDYLARTMGINTSMMAPGSATPPTFADKALQGIWDSLKVISWPLRKLVNPISTITGLSSLSKNVLPDKNLLASAGFGPLSVAGLSGLAGFAGGGALGFATRYGSRGGLFGPPLETPPPGTDYRTGRAGFIERQRNRAGARYRASESGQALQRSRLRGAGRGGILGAFVGIGAGILAGGSAPDVAGVLGYLTALNAAGILAAKAVNRLIVPIAKLAVVTPFKITRALARDVGLYPQAAVPNPEAGTALTKYDPEARDALKYNPKTGEAYKIAQSNKWTKFQESIQLKADELSQRILALKSEINSGTLSAKQAADSSRKLSEMQFDKKALSANLNLSKIGKWFMQEPRWTDMARPIQGVKASVGGILGSLAGGSLLGGVAGPFGGLFGALLGGPIGNSLTRRLPSVLGLGLRPITNRLIAGPVGRAAENVGSRAAANFANLTSRVGESRLGAAAARGVAAAGEAGVVELGGNSIKALLGAGGGLSGLMLPGLLLGFQQYGTSSSKQLAADAERMYKSGELNAAEWKRFNDRLNGAGAQYGKGAATVGTTDGQLNSVLDKALEKKLGDRTGKTLGLSALSGATLGITGLLGVGATQTDKQQEAMAERIKKILAPPADALNGLGYGKFAPGGTQIGKERSVPANFQSLQAMDTSLRGAKTQAGMGFGQSAQAVETRKQLQEKILRAEADLQAASQNGLNTAAKKELQAFINKNREIYDEQFSRSKKQLHLEELFGKGLEDVKKGQNTKNTALVEDGYAKIKKATGLKLKDIRKLVTDSGAKTGREYAAAISGAFDAKMPKANQTALNAALKTLEAGYKKQGGANFKELKAVGDSVGLNPDEIAKLIDGAKTGPSAAARIMAGIRAKEATNGLDYTQVDKNKPLKGKDEKDLKAQYDTNKTHLKNMTDLYVEYHQKRTAANSDYFDKLLSRSTKHYDVDTRRFDHHTDAMSRIARTGGRALTLATTTSFGDQDSTITAFAKRYDIPIGKAHGGLIEADPHKIGPGYPIRVAEEGHAEMIIPLAPHRRERAKSLVDQTRSMIGYANGGATEARSSRLSRDQATERAQRQGSGNRGTRERATSTTTTRMDRVMNEANRIEALHIPYLYGGGHDGRPVTASSRIDCSAAVSALLQAGGYYRKGQVSDSTGMMNIGKSGAGAFTILANPGHVYAVLNGKGWGTSGSNPQGGPGWIEGRGIDPGFSIRHMPDTGSTDVRASAGGGGGSSTPTIPNFKLEAWRELHGKGLQPAILAKLTNRLIAAKTKDWEKAINDYLQGGGSKGSRSAIAGLGKKRTIRATVFGSDSTFTDPSDAGDPATAAGIGYREDNMRAIKWVWGEIGNTALGTKDRGYKFHVQRGHTAAILGKYDRNDGANLGRDSMDIWIHAAKYLGFKNKGAGFAGGEGPVQIREVPQSAALGPTAPKYGAANGGLLKGDPYKVGPGYPIRVAEEGHAEMIIPLAPHRRERARSLVNQVKGMLGFKDGGTAEKDPIAHRSKRADPPPNITYGRTRIEKIKDRASKISHMGSPYFLGGGHVESTRKGPYDCSGALASLLRAGGVWPKKSLAPHSSLFGSAGHPGKGRFTIYYSNEHVWSTIDGRLWQSSPSNRNKITGYHAPRGTKERYLRGDGGPYRVVHVPHVEDRNIYQHGYPHKIGAWHGGQKGHADGGMVLPKLVEPGAHTSGLDRKDSSAHISKSPGEAARHLQSYSNDIWAALHTLGALRGYSLGGTAPKTVISPGERHNNYGMLAWVRTNNLRKIHVARNVVARWHYGNPIKKNESGYYQPGKYMGSTLVHEMAHLAQNPRLRNPYVEGGASLFAHHWARRFNMPSFGDYASEGRKTKKDLGMNWVLRKMPFGKLPRSLPAGVRGGGGIHGQMSEGLPTKQHAWAGWHAKGGDFRATSPTLFGVGEKGPERISITPENKPMTATKSEGLLQRLLDVATGFRTSYEASSSRALALRIRGGASAASASASSSSSKQNVLTSGQGSERDQFKGAERGKLDAEAPRIISAQINKAKAVLKVGTDTRRAYNRAKTKLATAIKKAGKKVSSAEKKRINSAKKALRKTAGYRATRKIKALSPLQGKSTTELGGMVARGQRAIDAAKKKLDSVRKKAGKKLSKAEKKKIASAQKVLAAAKKKIAVPKSMLKAATGAYKTAARGRGVGKDIIDELLAETKDPLAGGIQSDDDLDEFQGQMGDDPTGANTSVGASPGGRKKNTSKETAAQKKRRLARKAAARKAAAVRRRQAEWRRKHNARTGPPMTTLQQDLMVTTAEHKGAPQHTTKASTPKKATKGYGAEIVKAIKEMHTSVKNAPAPNVTVHAQAQGAKIKTTVIKPTTRGR